MTDVFYIERNKFFRKTWRGKISEVVYVAELANVPELNVKNVFCEKRTIEAGYRKSYESIADFRGSLQSTDIGRSIFVPEHDIDIFSQDCLSISIDKYEKVSKGLFSFLEKLSVQTVGNLKSVAYMPCSRINIYVPLPEFINPHNYNDEDLVKFAVSIGFDAKSMEYPFLPRILQKGESFSF